MKTGAHIILCIMIAHDSTQFTSSGRQPKTPCEIHGTALVEQFFNIIFAEFHRSPPTCICVQMCPDQPTYCYPNGCFKRPEKKRDTPVSRIQHEGSKPMFLVDNDKNFLTDVMGNINSGTPSVTGKPENSNYYLIGRPNPFKDVVFKYKRLPKLEIKYNLREQVKQTKEKRAEVDVSKTRWPTNKLNRMPYKINQQRNSNHLASAFSETNQPETPKNFKKYLTKRENQNSLDIGALYLYKDASNFSLETLIDNLIERGLEGVNSTLGLKINKSGELKDEDKGNSQFVNSITEDVTKDTTREVNVTKENQNNANNKFNVLNSTAVYFEMITTLSNEIEKQNVASIKAMELKSGRNYEKNSTKNISVTNLQGFINVNSTNTVAENESETLIKPEGTEHTTSKAPESLLEEVTPVINGQVKKSKQRIVRKLRYRKLN